MQFIDRESTPRSASTAIEEDRLFPVLFQRDVSQAREVLHPSTLRDPVLLPAVHRQ
jgi:hypothetical protein